MTHDLWSVILVVFLYIIHINNELFLLPNSLAVIANVDMKESDVVENVMSSVSQIGDSIPGGWKNIKQLNLKTGKSPSIPIFMSSGQHKSAFFL